MAAIYVWTAEEISRLIAGAEDVASRPGAHYNYAPLIQLLTLTGLRVSEALALRWRDVDLLGAELHINATLGETAS